MAEDRPLRISRIPDEDATDWERAMIMSDDLWKTGIIGERQAKVYVAAGVFDIDAETVQEKLEITEEEFFSAIEDAQDTVKNARNLVAFLDDHPAIATAGEPIDEIAEEEFDVHHDRFSGDVRHERGDDDLVGEKFVTDHNHVGTVVQWLDPTESEATGYIVNVMNVKNGCVDHLAISATWIEEMLEKREIHPCSLKINREEPQ